MKVFHKARALVGDNEGFYTGLPEGVDEVVEFPLPAGVLEDNLVAIAVLVGAEGFAGTGADRVLVIPFFLSIPCFQLIAIPALGIDDSP